MKICWHKKTLGITKLVALLTVLYSISLHPVAKAFILETDLVIEIAQTDSEESQEEEKTEDNSTDEKIELQDLNGLQIPPINLATLFSSYSARTVWVFPPEIPIPPPDAA